MSLSSQAEPLQEALEKFCQRLYFKVPMELAHCSQFSNDTEILGIAEEEKTIVWSELLQKLGDLAKTGEVSIDEQVSIVNQFAPRIQSLIDDAVKRHGAYKEEAETIMMGRIHQFCDYFSSSINEKLLLEKDMDIHSLDEHLERGKSMTLNHFANWRHGNLAFYDDHEKILKEGLEQLANEVLKNQWKHLGGCAEIRTPQGQHERNEVTVVTGTLSDGHSGNNGTLDEIQMRVPVEEEGSILEIFSGNPNISVTSEVETAKAESKICDDAVSTNQPSRLLDAGSEQMANRDETFIAGKSQGEEIIPRDTIRQSDLPTLLVLNAVEEDNSQPKLEGFGERQCDNICTDLNDGIPGRTEGFNASHFDNSNGNVGNVDEAEGHVVVISENSSPSSEVVAQSEGFSDEENITVVSTEAWTSTSAGCTNDQNTNGSVEIEDTNENDTEEIPIATDSVEESKLRSDSSNIKPSRSEEKGRKRRRSQKENNGLVPMAAKRRRKIKDVPLTAPRQSPTLQVKKTKKVAVAVKNSSTKIRRSKRNSKLALEPEETATAKKQNGTVKFSSSIAKIVPVEGGYQCPEPNCEKIFSLSRNCRQHHKEMHQLKDVEFQCSYPKCKKVFSRKRALASHQLFHIQPELFTCENCQRTFAKTSTTREHRKSCGGNQSTA